MDGRFVKGVELFNNRRFFEAHDVWEELWRETRGEERLFYQGLIHTAVGFYHLLNENYRGACSQLGKALTKLQPRLPAFKSIDALHLVEQVDACRQDAGLLIRGLEDRLDRGKIPQITMIETQQDHTEHIEHTTEE